MPNATVAPIEPSRVPWATTEAEAAQVLWTVIRPGYLIALFFAGWAANVCAFSRYHVNYSNVLGLAHEELASPRHFCMLALYLIGLLGAFRSLVQIQGPTPSLLCLCLLGYLFCVLLLYTWLPQPFERTFRWRVPLRRALWRCLVPDTSKGTPFIEVLVADGLTSTAKVFFDLALGSCVTFMSVDISDLWLELNFSELPVLVREGPPPRSRLGDALGYCSSSPMPYFAWLSPFLIRSVQCILSSRHAADQSTKDAQKINLLKYLTSFPVVLFAYCYANSDDTENYFAPGDYEALWAIAAIINATFSFMWDMTMDWGLLQPGPIRSRQFGLRPVLLFRSIWGFYYVAILLNIIGRTLWSLRWSSEAALVLGGLFLTSFQQAAEVSRRCLWNVLRVEWECVKRGVYHADKGHIAMEI